ncbi:MAG: hypothetical protein AAF517_21235, partial [Planctomycetota bacterium]
SAAAPPTVSLGAQSIRGKIRWRLSDRVLLLHETKLKLEMVFSAGGRKSRRTMERSSRTEILEGRPKPSKAPVTKEKRPAK